MKKVIMDEVKKEAKLSFMATSVSKSVRVRAFSKLEKFERRENGGGRGGKGRKEEGGE